MSKLLSFLEKRSRWSDLRNLGQSNLVRASVLLPVFGYLLLFNDTVHQLTIRYLHDGPVHLSSMWRIYFLYYGSFLLAAASLFFAWRCPKDIKDYPNHFRMVDAERSHLVAHEQQDRIAKQLKALYESM